MVSKFCPLTETVSESHLACGTRRSRNVSLCPRAQTFVDGRMNAAAAEIGFRFALPDASVPAARAVVTATDIAAPCKRDDAEQELRVQAVRPPGAAPMFGHGC